VKTRTNKWENEQRVPEAWNRTSGPPGPVDSRLMKAPTWPDCLHTAQVSYKHALKGHAATHSQQAEPL